MNRPQFRLSTLLWITLVVACWFGGIVFERWRVRAINPMPAEYNPHSLNPPDVQDRAISAARASVVWSDTVRALAKIVEWIWPFVLAFIGALVVRPFYLRRKRMRGIIDAAPDRASPPTD